MGSAAEISSPASETTSFVFMKKPLVQATGQLYQYMPSGDGIQVERYHAGRAGVKPGSTQLRLKRGPGALGFQPLLARGQRPGIFHAPGRTRAFQSHPVILLPVLVM